MRKPKKTVLIVDDESMVRIGLKSIIDWESSPFSLIGEARDGKQGLALCEELEPDIVITDIKMPVMNGIQMLKEMKQRGSRAKVLILSGHDEYPLVREAMKLGASDYLRKLDIQPEQLLACLQELSNEEAEAETLPPAQSLPALRRTLLQDIVSGFYLRQDEAAAALKKLGIRLQGEIYCFFIKTGGLHRFEDSTAEQVQTLTFSVMHIAEEVIGSVCHAYCFAGKTGEFLVLASQRETRDGQTREEMIRLAKRLRKVLLQYLDIAGTIGIGYGRGVQEIKLAYERAAEVIANRFYQKEEEVLFWQKKAKPSFREEYDISGIKRSLAEALTQEDGETADEVFADVSALIADSALSPKAVRMIALEIFVVIKEYMFQFGLQEADVLGRELRDYNEVLAFATAGQVKNWLESVRKGLHEYFSSYKKQHRHHSVEKARAYIREQYACDLSLSMVAARVGLTPFYLSTLMKKETGMGYTEYLTHIRMQKARELLENTQEKIYEVGRQVGYEDKFYFSRIFKQTVGMTPGEYRSKMAERGHRDEASKE